MSAYVSARTMPECGVLSLYVAREGKLPDFKKGAIATTSCGCVLFLQLAIRQGRTNEAFHRTADTRCPCRSEMSEDIRPVRAVPAREGKLPKLNLIALYCVHFFKSQVLYRKYFNFTVRGRFCRITELYAALYNGFCVC